MRTNRQYSFGGYSHLLALLTMNISSPELDRRRPLPQPQPSPLKWTIPSLVSDKGLASVAVETLRVCLQPVLDGLQALDSEALLELQRCRPDEQGGAVLRDK